MVKNASWRLILPPFLVLIITIFSCLLGQYTISLSEFFEAFYEKTTASNVLFNIRFPRICAAILVGSALSVAGATYQSMFKNPLISPDILGVSAGAGLGASLMIFLNGSLLSIQTAAFLGGLLAVTLTYLISKSARYHQAILALVLSGIAISSLFKAFISLVKIFADPYTELTTITFWLLGGLNLANFKELKIVFVLLTISLTPLILLRYRMNLLSLSDEEAQSLGINIQKTRLIFIFCATLMTSAVVAIAGIIGWVGLVIPHICRLYLGKMGSDFRLLLPTSIFFGSGFLLLADTISRTAFSVEIPLGIITAFVGVPFFISLLILGGKR